MECWVRLGSIIQFTWIVSISVHVAKANEKDVKIERPHIIFILVDDMGWGDVGFHGSDQIPTPNIDALAYNGVILNRHYTLPACTPSRTALMTGRYPIREGMQAVPLTTGEARGIPLNITLMPGYLKRLGYDTNLIGKWHLGYLTKEYTPTYRGFDYFYGYYNGLISYFKHSISGVLRDDKNPRKKVTGHDLHRDIGKSFSVPHDSGYMTDMITREAVDVIRKNANKKPLFLEISHLAVHAGQLKDALEVPNHSQTNKTFSHIKDLRRQKYAGMVGAMDESVGRVVIALKENGMLENSIIVFISDNGAPSTGILKNPGSNYPLRGTKSTLFEGGIRTAACIFSPLIKSSLRLPEKLMHITDWLPTLYSAANGKIEDLGEIDGLDQWPTISHGSQSPRKAMLLNIKKRQGIEGAIIGNHKLLKKVRPHQKAENPSDGYYKENGSDPTNEIDRVQEALSSDTGLAIKQLSGFNSISNDKAWELRKIATVNCDSELERPLPSCSGVCLFDIESDPCETENLAQYHPEIVSELEALINKYRIHYVEQERPGVDPCSSPEYFNGTWMPWRAGPNEEWHTTVNGCRHPIY